MKLISMTDFVLEQHGFSDVEVRLNTPFANERFRERVSNYANFLKQPLKLEMFVPCDENGNLLEEIIFSEQVHIYLNYQEKQDYVKRCDVYKKAKEKVLFEDISVQNSKEWIEFYGAIRVYIETDIKEKMFSHVFRKEYPKHKTIEDLTKYDLTLTLNAIKQLGL